MSRRTFYEHFGDKEVCFLAAYEHGVDAMVAELGARFEHDETWRERVDGVLDIFLASLASEPGFARAFLVEMWAAGPAAFPRHLEVLEQFHALLRAIHEQARAELPDVVPISDTVIAAVAGGITRVATTYVLQGRASELPQLKPELLGYGLALLAGTDSQLAEGPA